MVRTWLAHGKHGVAFRPVEGTLARAVEQQPCSRTCTGCNPLCVGPGCHPAYVPRLAPCRSTFACRSSMSSSVSSSSEIPSKVSWVSRALVWALGTWGRRPHGNTRGSSPPHRVATSFAWGRSLRHTGSQLPTHTGCRAAGLQGGLSLPNLLELLGGREGVPRVPQRVVLDQATEVTVHVAHQAVERLVHINQAAERLRQVSISERASKSQTNELPN